MPPKRNTIAAASSSLSRGRGRGRSRGASARPSRGDDHRKWSELPREILHLFSKKLPDLSDFVRFRAVCRSWFMSAPITDPPPQLPWLLERREDPEEDRENAIIRFYCLSSKKVHTVFCPGSRRAWLEGPGYRYLIASHSRSFETYLLNPLTSDEIDYSIPKVFGYSHYVGPNGDIVIVSGGADHFRLPNMEWNTAPPMVAFLRPEYDEDWALVEAGVGESGNAFYMGQYFGNDEKTGITKVVDLATRRTAYQVEPPEGTDPLKKGRTVLVESGGKILRLFQYSENKIRRYDIFCLCLDGIGKPRWVKISNIGDQMLFLDGYNGLSFSANNFPGFTGNCIYDIDCWCLCKYNIKDGTTEVPSCPFDSMQTWFVPSLV